MMLLQGVSGFFAAITRQQVLALGSFSKAWRFSGSSDFPILVRGELILVAWHHLPLDP